MAKEQKWLSYLAQYLSLSIPESIALGQPSKEFERHWSVYRWLPGKSANTMNRESLNLPAIAKQLGTFLHELHAIKSADGPLPGLHNYHRGGHPSIYNEQTIEIIAALSDVIDSDAATAVWQQALAFEWHGQPVWLHGDLYPSNVLCQDGKLSAVIDFGCMGIGDPACDLVIAWVLFDQKSRKIFKSHFSFDQNTWNRARGWALWKAIIQLETVESRSENDAVEQQRIIQAILHNRN